MDLTRRNFITTGSCVIALSAIIGTPAYAALVDEAIEKFTGGAEAGEGTLSLTAPEIAENGNTVPIDVEAPGAVAIAIFADGNPDADVVTFKFGPLNPNRSASTRIRLSQTQNVIAIAKMEDGSLQRAQANVKVTIGGCGG